MTERPGGSITSAYLLTGLPNSSWAALYSVVRMSYIKCSCAPQHYKHKPKRNGILRNRINFLSGVPPVGGGQETKSPAREINPSQGPGTRYDRRDFAAAVLACLLIAERVIGKAWATQLQCIGRAKIAHSPSLKSLADLARGLRIIWIKFYPENGAHEQRKHTDWTR